MSPLANTLKIPAVLVLALVVSACAEKMAFVDTSDTVHPMFNETPYVPMP